MKYKAGQYFISKLGTIIVEITGIEEEYYVSIWHSATNPRLAHNTYRDEISALQMYTRDMKPLNSEKAQLLIHMWKSST